MYAGSPHRIDFGEEKEDKGIILVEVPDNPALSKSAKTTYEFISTNCRKFLTITVNLKGKDPDPTKTILDEIKKHEVAEKVVRVTINIPAECENEIEMDKIKKALSSANFVAGISKNIERIERIRFDGSTKIESLTPIDALKKYFEFKKYPPQKQKELEKYAAQLLEG